MGHAIIVSSQLYAHNFMQVVDITTAMFIFYYLFKHFNGVVVVSLWYEYMYSVMFSTAKATPHRSL